MRIDQTILLTIERLARGIRRRLRTLYYSRVLKSMGKGCAICDGVLFFGPEHISLGDRVSVNEGVVLQSCEGCDISIGDRVTLSYGVRVITGGLILGAEGAAHGEHKSKAICVEHSAWIGAGALLLPGIRVGAGSVIAAGSVVTRDVESYTIVGGVPAKVIRSLRTQE